MERNQLNKKSASMSMWKIILVVIAVVYVMSFIVPSGAFERDGKMVIAGTYHVIEKTFLNPIEVILAVGDTAYQIFGKLFVNLIVMGGMMQVVNSTGVIDQALGNLIYKMKDKALVIIPIYIFATGLLGCVGSLISSAVLFVPLGLSIAKQLKADRCFGVGLAILGSYTGFMSSPINPLTVILGQEIAGVTPYSGAGFRTIITIINLTVVSAYLIWWVKRCRRDPSSYLEDFGDDVAAAASVESEIPGFQGYRSLSVREITMLVLFFGTFAFIAVGGPALDLSMTQLTSIMLPVAFVEGVLAHYDIDKTMQAFVKGSQSMCSVMVFMILASLMTVILNNSGIMDTLVYYLSIPLNYLSNGFAAVGMFIANAIVNLFINSGSGQTTVMMPIMAPLADVVHVSRQMSVLTVQFGDGFTNLLSPTSSNLMICLAAGGVGLKRWMKFLLPCYGILMVIMIASLFLGIAIGF